MFQAPQPDNSCGCLLCSPDYVADEFSTVFVNRCHEISAVVHGNVGAMIQGSVDVSIVGFAVLSVDSKNGDAVFYHQAGSGIILS